MPAANARRGWSRDADRRTRRALMRFAIVRQHYRPGGAVESVVERALEALLERNVAVSLYTRAWPESRLKLVEPTVCDPFHAGALWRDWGFARAACRAIARSKPTLVESHERLVCCDVYRASEGVHAARLEERTKRASARERAAAALSPHDAYLLRAERRLFASAWLRAVICPSNMVRDEIRDRFALPKAKLPVIYNPVDGALFHPGLRADRAAVLKRHGIDEDAVVYLTVASDFARSGVDAAIDALAELPAASRLVVVGDDPAVDTYRRQAQDRGVAGRVTMVGAQDDPRPYYGAADVFVLPVLYDPAPQAAHEAMACGLPVITSTKSGAAELLQEGEAGLVCDARDRAGLAAHMRGLQDCATRAHFAANARRTVEPLTPAAATLQLVLLYRDLLTAAVPPAVDAGAVPGGPAERAGAMPASGDDAGDALPVLDTRVDLPLASGAPEPGTDPAATAPRAP